MKKQVLSALLTLVMVFTLLPATAQAEEEPQDVDDSATLNAVIADPWPVDNMDETDTIQPSSDWYTTEATEYTITTAGQLAGLAQLVNNGNKFESKTIHLGADIDLDGYTWVPIGASEESPFAGTFDGHDYTIENITISAEGENVGFFGFLSRATVKNLKLHSVSFTSVSETTTKNIGALCGSLCFIPSEINNCHVSDMCMNQIEATNIGGLIGYLFSWDDESENKILIKDSSVEDASLDVSSNYLGGLIGNNGSYSCSVLGCSVTGSTLSNNNSHNSSACGGIAGRTAAPDPYIECSVDTSSVSAYNVGGFLGISTYGGTLDKARISSCTVTAIAENGSVAGLLGTVNANPVTIVKCSLTDITIQAKAQDQLNVLLASGSLGTTEYEQSNIKFYLNKVEVLPYKNEGVEYLLRTDSRAAIVMGLSGQLTDGNLVIPDFVEYKSEKYPVSTITASAFSGNTSIKTLALGNQLTNIPASAFKDCVKLSGTLVIPNSVSTIGESAFRGCTSLEGITIGAGVTVIEKHAFNGCSNVVTLSLGKSVQTIAPAAFANLEALSGTLVIPQTVTSLQGNAIYTGTGAFSNCNKIECVILENNGISVGAYVFENFENLKVFVASSATTFDAKAFSSGPNDITDNRVFYLIGDSVPKNIPSTAAKAVTNGGTFAPDTTFTADTLAEPVKEGYAFGGWYSDSSFETQAETVTAGQTYYAKWVRKITFDGNGATSGSMDVQQVTEGDTSTTLTTNTFDKTGYHFSDWNTKADGTGTSYENGAVVPATSTTLYAQWTANDYTISFNSNGSTETMADIKATYDTPVTLPLNSFTKADHKFAGWSRTEGGTTVDFSNGTEALNLTDENEGSVPLYAVWTTKTVLNPTVTAQTKTYNGEEQAFTLEGYTIEYQQNGEEATPKNAGSYDVVIFAPETDDTAAYHNTVYGGLVIKKAPLTVTADNKSIYVGEELPEEYAYTVTGWQGSDEESVGLTVSIECAAESADQPGSYDITVTGPKEIENYTITYVNGTLTVRTVPTAGSGNTEVTTNPDGSTVAVETKPDGTVITTVTRKDGVVVKAVEAPGKDATATVTVPDSVGTATVTIPAQVTPGTVAVDAATGKVIKLSMPTEDGMLVKLDGSAQLVLVDRSKDFNDVAGHWGEDSIDFAVAHGMFGGTGDTTFSPDSPMTRAMLMTVLARFDGENTEGGATWYEKGMEWAVASGVSDGTNPDGAITREQLVTMLYRYAGSPAGTGDLSPFADAGKVSGYAADAMGWAVSNGIIAGMGNNTLAPQGSATRAQVAAVLMRFCADLVR